MFGKQTIHFLTHLEFTDDMLQVVIEAVKKM